MVTSMNLGGSEIIVVDDDVSMSQAIGRLLAAAGLTSRTFASAEALLAKVATTEVATLILDIQLPGMSGLDLYRHLIAAGGSPAAIFITGQDRPGIRNQVLQSGALAYFTKPFDGNDLIRTICQHLKSA